MNMIVGIKFHFEQTISNFSTKFATKRIFRIKNKDSGYHH